MLTCEVGWYDLYMCPGNCRNGHSGLSTYIKPAAELKFLMSRDFSHTLRKQEDQRSCGAHL